MFYFHFFNTATKWHKFILPGSTVVQVGLSWLVDFVVVQTWTLRDCDTSAVTNVIKDHP